LATLLSNNLPHFGQRAGGLTNNNRFDYYKCIAANIVDYIDTNQTPSIQTGAGGYRGTEALPLVSEVAMSIQWTGQRITNNQIFEDFEVVPIVEYWNMFDKSINISNIVFSLTSTLKATVGINNLNLSNYPLKITNTVSLSPNQYGVYIPPTSTKISLISGFNPALVPSYGLNPTTFITIGKDGASVANYLSRWTLEYGGDIYDKCDSFEESPNNLYCEPFATRADRKRPFFKSHVPALRLACSGGSLFGTGDLRITYFMTNKIDLVTRSPGIFNANDFDVRASFGYRNLIYGNLATRKGATNRPDLWLDGGHANSILPNSPTPGVMTRVFEVTSIDQSATKISSTWAAVLEPKPFLAAEAPAHIADAQMTNIFELGRIFDPMQWETAKITSDSNPQPINPTNITSTSIADFQQGGGNTLRVGRAEHQRFAFSDRFGTDPVPFLGQSAASLLDLFTVMDPTTGESAGRININTA
ncbi:hypothetical protein EBX31_13345, partial [bacterium]|nr:hypothetical protein [bacterium]